MQQIPASAPKYMADDHLKSPILLINSYLVSGLPPLECFLQRSGGAFTPKLTFSSGIGGVKMRCFCEITEKDRGFDNFACQIPRSSQFFVPLNGKLYIVWVE